MNTDNNLVFEDVKDYEEYLDNPKEWKKRKQLKDKAESIVVRRIEQRGIEADPFHGGYK